MSSRALSCLLALVACDGSTPAADAGAADAASLPDARPAPDAAAALDASTSVDAEPSPDAQPGADAATGDDAGSGGTGACAGRACLDRITSDAEFERLSRPSPHGNCQFDRELHFIIPKSPRATFQSAFFIDARAHRHVVDFVRQDLGQQLDVEQYFRTFEREDMREYHVGRIRRRVGVAQHRYAVDVFGSGYWAECGANLATDVERVLARLAQSFTLPLAYAPGTYHGITEAAQLRGTSFEVVLPELCPGEACPPGNGPCLIIPAGAELCGEFVENRSIQGEHRRQTRVQLAAGSHRVMGGAQLPFIVGGAHGPDGTPITSSGDARVVATNAGGSTVWTLEQRVLAGAEAIDVTLSIWNPDAPMIFREPYFGDVRGYGTIGGGMTQDDVVQLASCSHDGMPLFFAEAALGGGDHVRVEYRHQLPFAGSGPLLPIAADLRLGGNAVRLEGYPSLLYAGVHHNWDNQFWLQLGAPIMAFGHEVHGLWIDEADHRCCPVDSIRTFGADRRPLDTLDGSSYLRAPAQF